MTEYLASIGLETHIQLNTLTKAFCSCRADSRNDPPNTNICPVCSGQPGALPSPNAEMVRKAVRLCLAVNAEVRHVSFFDRKNYLYADMPGGYQVSQYDQPIGSSGFLDVDMPDGRTVRVHIDNLHMEEDAGKTRNADGIRLIDLNRAGVPLVEMVTDPDLHSADEAAAYLIQLRRLIRWIDVSEGNMELAQLRCDANVSVAPAGSGNLGKKCEIKNINSIEAVRKAINSEIARQIRELEAGRRIEQWTIEWDNESRELRKMRSKEESADYRYFREPNLMPVVVSPEMVEQIRSEMPELPWERRRRFISDYALPAYDAGILTADRDLSEYFEETLKYFKKDPKKVSNWIINEIVRLIRESGIPAGELLIRPRDLGKIIRMTDEKQISMATGKELIGLVQKSGKDPAEIAAEQGLALVSDETVLQELCERIVHEHPAEAASYRNGRENLAGWFTGQVMRETKGKADPKLVGKLLKEVLKRLPEVKKDAGTGSRPEKREE